MFAAANPLFRAARASSARSRHELGELALVYCTFDGEQDVANEEISGPSLALQWLKGEDNLQMDGTT